jgi:peroxiredoxin
MLNGTAEPQALQRLVGMPFPSVVLRGAVGGSVVPGHADVPWVLYLYPGSDTSEAHGSDTPLADAQPHRGFRDLHKDLAACHHTVIGVSSQPLEKRRRAIGAHRLTHQLASDGPLQLADQLSLPTFKVGGLRFYQRLTLVVANGVIVLLLYPVLVPGRNAAEVLAWLKTQHRPGIHMNKES